MDNTNNTESAQEDFEWILDCIVEYLQSPEWKTPILEFIDDHCLIFDDGESSHDAADVHKAFCVLIDEKLDEFCETFGITQDIFLVACSQAKSKIHKQIIAQILAVEDFVLFKRTMIARNHSLN
jgi:hypothetical protein